MAPGRKQGGGCWTCRLRRKRCDSVRPICGSCQVLEITCYSGELKPAWMDGGVRQKHTSENIKEQIKQNTHLRRERRRCAYQDQGMTDVTEPEHISQATGNSMSSSQTTNHSSSTGVVYTPPADPVASTPLTNLATLVEIQPSFHQSEEPRFPFTINSSTSGRAEPISVQLGSVMIYLDYVFPFLFPFYQPSLVETGRQWLLGLLCQNEVSFHIAASLSAYFFALFPQDDEPDLHEDCKALVRDRLVEQMDLAIKSMQSTVSAINHYGTQSPLLDRVRIMEEIIQLLIVEVNVRSNTDWTVHLKPALALFDEMFKSHGTDNLKPSIAILLTSLPSSLPPAVQHHKSLPNTADQSALVFFVSLLLFIDVIASTSLRTSPALHRYHHSLMSFHLEEKYRMRLETVVGCMNFALVAIGNISTLCAWKRDAKRNGSFSVVSLVKLAEPISQALEEGLAGLDSGELNFRSKPHASTSLLSGYYGRHDRAVDDTAIANVTRIWAYAAKIYLFVSLSGWQVKSADVQTIVTDTLRLLQSLESPAQLRSLSWPICVAGCLALRSQEHDFRSVIGKMGQLSEFGTILVALNIMEAVWSSRGTLDGDSWDIASSLNVLGSPSLLV